MPTNDSETDKKTKFLLEVLKRYDHYIATTNFKVGLLMSFLGAIILGLTIRIMLLAHEVIEFNCVITLAIIFSTLTILFSLYASTLLLRTVFPDTTNKNNNKDSIVFFGDVSSQFNSPKEYFETVKVSSSTDLLKDLATQTHNVACVTDEKFKILKKAVNTIRLLVIPILAFSLILLIYEGVVSA